MRRKTYLSPEAQWERSVEFLLTTWERGEWTWGWLKRRDGREPEAPYADLPRLGDRVWLGQIVMAHPLFLPGDLAFVWPNNGWTERFPVWGVSSKGYRVHGLYLKFQSWWSGNPAKEQRTPALPLAGEQTEHWDGRIQMRREAGPLRLIELPDDLVGCSPDDPAAWHFVATLRAGYAASG